MQWIVPKHQQIMEQIGEQLPIKLVFKFSKRKRRLELILLKSGKKLINIINCSNFFEDGY
jgi:hypothetical protein